MHPQSSIPYRPEIDGLRALAVLPVIFYHAGFTILSGGFLGVDIFFVISGYLITLILLKDMQGSAFSIINFYERRIRRIMPLLTCVIITCLPFAWVIMTPQEMQMFGQSILSTAYFVSNFYFWQQIDYFNPSSDQYPLIHTWSLAIEEQFYIVFPFILFLAHRYAQKALMPMIILGFLFSLGLAEYAAREYPQANFFLLPTRGWELLVGAIIALNDQKLQNVTGKIAQPLSLIGLFLLFISYFFLNEDMHLPGLLSLIPVGGGILIIAFARQKTLVGRILSLRPMIFIGLISYGLYLWHQPTFAFARLYYWEDITAYHYAFLIVLVFALSVASWKWVETYFRQRHILSRKSIFIFFTSTMVMLTLIGGIIHLAKGFPTRNDRVIMTMEIENRLSRNGGIAQTCNTLENTPPECQTDTHPEILLWGDSYAMHLAQGLLAANPSVKMIQKTASVCGPFFNISPIIPPKYNEARAKKCIAFNNGVKSMIGTSTSLQYVILSSPFVPYLNQRSSVFKDDQNIKNINWSAKEDFLKTLDWIKSKGKTPIIVSPPPRTGRDFKSCYLRMIQMGPNANACDFPITTYESYSADVINFLKSIEPYYRVIWLSDYLCSDGICHTYNEDNDVYFYNDDGHLSIEGSRFLGEKLMKPSNFYDLLKD